MRRTELQNSLPPLIQNSPDLLIFKAPAKPIYFPTILGEWEVCWGLGLVHWELGSLCGWSVVLDYFFPDPWFGIGRVCNLFFPFLVWLAGIQGNGDRLHLLPELTWWLSSDVFPHNIFLLIMNVFPVSQYHACMGLYSACELRHWSYKYLSLCFSLSMQVVPLTFMDYSYE